MSSFSFLIRSSLGGAASLLLATVAVAQVTPPAVLNPSDPSLRLWLDARTLGDDGLIAGDWITSWVDKSSYGTIMAPRTTTNPNGPFIGDPVEEHPYLQYVNIAGNSVPTVRFDRDGPVSNLGDPNVPGTGAADRLYQTNNLGPGDPLDIGDGSSLTTFIVFNPDIISSLGPGGGPILGYQAVYSKRGASSSVYQLGIVNYPNRGDFSFVSYDGPVEYFSEMKPTEKVWHVTSQVVTDFPGATDVDTLQFFTAEGMDPNQSLVEMGTLANPSPNPGLPGSPRSTIQGRNASTPEPFGIGGTSQPCCGEGEAFAGNIAELIIFARILTPEEYSSVTSYLSMKYFTPAPTTLVGDYNDDGIVDGADLTVWQTQFGSPAPAPPNADGNGDGQIDGADFLVWQQNIGAVASSSSAGSIPEPASAVILACGLMMMASRRVRHQSRLTS